MKHELESNSLVSVLAPIYNEAENIDAFVREVHDALTELSLPCPFELILCDDGSHDGSSEKLDQWVARHPDQICVIHLARNFGHSAALSACIEHAHGDIVIVMDGDMQDDPAAFREFIERWRAGCDVVYAIRTSREENALLRLLYWLFYRLLNWMAHVDMPLDAGNFGLMDRRVVDCLRQMPERILYLPGLRAWVGFNQAGVGVRRRARYDRKNRVRLRGLCQLAMNAIFSFSIVPLFAFRVMGIIVIIPSGFLVVVAMLRVLIRGTAFSPAVNLLVIILFFLGVNLVGLAILGEYLVRIYEEVKGRPKYIIDRIAGNGTQEHQNSASCEYAQSQHID
jgi:polyisoprenyl-phosphate glycosyltransferase